MTPRAELRAAAEAATNRRLRQCGPCSRRAIGCNLVWSDDNHELPYAGGDEVCSTNADARYIALASPATVVGLLDQLDAAEREVAALREAALGVVLADEVRRTSPSTASTADRVERNATLLYRIGRLATVLRGGTP